MQGFSLDTYLKELEGIVNIDSGSRNVVGIGKVADYFTQRFEAMGWRVTRHIFREDIGPTIEIRNSDAENIDILMIGHMDTVFVDGTASKRPFNVADGKAYGPGALDMKSGLMNALYICEALNKTAELDLNICVVMNGDEEISSTCSQFLITELAKKSSCCFVMESGRDGDRMVNKRKGLAKYVVEFFGKPAHAGVAPQDGASAIHEMANWVVQLVKLNQYEIGTSLNVGFVSGGTVPNVVAERARIEIDTRFELIEEQQKIERTLTYLEKNITVDGVSAEWSVLGNRPPMNPTKETETLMAIVNAAGDRVGYKVAGFVATGGGSDANFTAAAGCPSLDGMGPSGEGAHGNSEWFDISKVEPRIDLMIEVLNTLSANKKANGAISL